jgi:hypothetical protein
VVKRFRSGAATGATVRPTVLIMIIGSLTRARFPIMRRSRCLNELKPLLITGSRPIMPDELGRVTTGYQRWLARQPLSVNTRRAYLGRVRQYSSYLAACVNDYGNPLTDPHTRDYAIRDFKSHPKKSMKAKPASVNFHAVIIYIASRIGLFFGRRSRDQRPRFTAA